MLQVPELKYSLFSSGEALDKRLKMISDKHKYVFKRNNNIVMYSRGERKIISIVIQR